MPKPEKLFSERHAHIAFDSEFLHPRLTPMVRERIAAAMAKYNQAAGLSDLLTQTRRMMAKNAALRRSRRQAQETWRPVIKMVLDGSTDQVFDVVELMHGILPPERQRGFSAEVNYAFEDCSLPWRLYRGAMMRPEVEPWGPPEMVGTAGLAAEV